MNTSLLPKYSIRMLLLITVGVAVFALLITYAMRGQMWAVGLAVAVGCLFVVTLVHAGLFLIVSLLANIVPERKAASETERSTLPRAPLPEAPH